MKTKFYKELIKKYQISDIEKNILYHYAKQNDLKFHNSKILSDYFSDITIHNEIINKIFIDNSIETLEYYLELLIPEEDKNINGAFFTPEFIINYILNALNIEKNSQIFDPSCGCGSFLLSAIKILKDKFNYKIKDIIKNNIFGSDILQYNINRAKIVFCLLALIYNEIIEEEDFNLICCDSLRQNWFNCFERNQNGLFDFIVGNPPYVKFQDLTEEYRKFLLDNFVSISNGTYNLYFAFFELGYRLLKCDGKLGYITPNNYFTSLSGESLRQYFHHNKCISHIIDFKDKKVFDAQTYTSITLINKKNNDVILYDRIKGNITPEKFLVNLSFSPNCLKSLNNKKWRLLKQDEEVNIKNIENIGTPIKNLFDINVGIATLNDELYFIDSNNSDILYYYKELDGIQFKIEKELTTTIFKISDFKEQSEILKNKRKIIFPYEIIDKKAKPIDEELMKLKFQECYKYFNYVKNILIKRNNNKSEIKPFYAYGRTQGLTKKGIKIVTPTFSQTPRFMIINDSDSLFCNGYGIFFKNSSNAQLFDDESLQFSNESNINILLKILNSIIMKYYINITSVSIEGGYPCYQKNFIEKFSIPCFSLNELNTLNSLNDKNEIDEFLIKIYKLKL